ncbi:MAG: NgoFVII family restriction endonuclease [Lentisphaerae bacterium]|nr:NgoFVII family restriction endonuclease [Lentisphaerota bacterium]
MSETPVGATRLRIVSGYATPDVAEKHLSQCPGLKIDVLVGMTGTGGIPLIHHKGFLALEGDNFTCSYSVQKNIHSKLASKCFLVSKIND